MKKNVIAFFYFLFPVACSLGQVDDRTLREELLEILDKDQSTRMFFVSLDPSSPKRDSVMSVMQTLDSTNLIRIVEILNSRGWVGPAAVGGDASNAIFLVIQHADLQTQEKYLPVMRDAVKKGNAYSQNLALLEDRIENRNGRKQIYGSQIGYNQNKTQYYVLPLLDPRNVDARRAAVGLEPIAEYVKRWNIIWDPAAME